MPVVKWEDATPEQKARVFVPWDGRAVSYLNVEKAAAKFQTTPQAIMQLGTPEGKFTARVADTLVGRGFLRAGQGLEDIANTGLDLASKAGLAPAIDRRKLQENRAADDQFMDLITKQGGQTEQLLGKAGARFFDIAVRSGAKYSAAGVGGLTATYGLVGAESANDAHNEAIVNGLEGADALAYAGVKGAFDLGTTAMMGKFLASKGLANLASGVTPGMRIAAQRIARKHGLPATFANVAKNIALSGAGEAVENSSQEAFQQVNQMANGFRDKMDWSQIADAAASGFFASVGTAGLFELNEALSPIKTKMAEIEPEINIAAEAVHDAEQFMAGATSERIDDVLTAPDVDELYETRYPASGFLAKDRAAFESIVAMKVPDRGATGARGMNAALKYIEMADRKSLAALSKPMNAATFAKTTGIKKTSQAFRDSFRDVIGEYITVEKAAAIESAGLNTELHREHFQAEVARQKAELGRDARVIAEVAARPDQTVTTRGIIEPTNAREALEIASGIATARTYKELQDTAERYGQDSYYSPGRTTQAVEDAEARRLNYHLSSEAKTIADEVLVNPANLTSTKQEGLKIRLADIDSAFLTERDAIMSAESPAEFANRASAMKLLQDEGLHLINALQAGGTPAAQMLALRRTAQHNMYGPVGILATATATKKAALTAAEKTEFTNDAVALTQKNQATERMETRVKEDTAMAILRETNKSQGSMNLADLYAKANALFNGGCDL